MYMPILFRLSVSSILVALDIGATAQPIDIGDRLELFVDDYLIEKLNGSAKLTLQTPQVRDIVLTHDKPWEGNTCAYHTIFQDDDKFRMYYRGSHSANGKPAHPEFTCYAESSDGIRWTKPSLGLIEFAGSKENNIVWKGPHAHNFCPFLDSNPACPPTQKRKALAGTPKLGGLQVFVSSDGLRWDSMTSEPVIKAKEKDFAFDSQNLAFWDSHRSEYRVYFRNWKGGHPKGVRSIQTATSKDFRTWTEPTWLEYPNVPDEQLYTNEILPYSRAPHLFLGFPSRIVGRRGDLVEGLFMSSRDGKSFRRWQEAIIRPGQNDDRWHNRSNYIWLGLAETASDLPTSATELSLYSGERYYQGDGVRVRRYTYRTDGFVSVNASYAGGSLLTKPITYGGGDELVLNMSTSAAGSILVELVDSDGKALPGFALEDCEELFGDDTKRIVKWKHGGSLGTHKGKPVRLRFELKDADLFSFRFAAR
jgi:hypothetical protein